MAKEPEEPLKSEGEGEDTAPEQQVKAEEGER
jgi:hypothetical protein